MRTVPEHRLHKYTSYGKVFGFITTLVTNLQPELQHNGQQIARAMLLPVFYCNLPPRVSSSLDYTSANEVVNTVLHGLRGAKLWKILTDTVFI